MPTLMAYTGIREGLAQNRYSIFGRYDCCMVPDAELRRRFPP